MTPKHTAIATIFVFALCTQAGDLVEDFANLDHWRPLTFAKIDKHSKYQCLTVDDVTAVELSADSSASAMTTKTSFSPTKTPFLTFRWKVDQVWIRGDATRKSGDDYPVRIYVVFPYDPAKASLKERLGHALAKFTKGDFLPHSCLNYVWANRLHKSRILPNAYTDRSQLVIQDSGTAHLGEWRTHTVNILEDYRQAFGESPPAAARLAIMIDADNTNDRGRSWIDFIRLSTTPPKN